MSRETRIHPTALVEPGVEIGAGSTLWDNVHVRGPGTTIGVECIVGGKSYIGPGVAIGDRVKINAFVYVCTGVTIEDGVMLAAGVTFTNDRYPRATTPDLVALLPSTPTGDTLETTVRAGATVGARAVIGPGLDVGRFAMVAMGTVVTRSVPDFHLVAGQPARTLAAIGRAGHPLVRAADGRLPDVDAVTCPRTGLRYQVVDDVVVELDLPS
ncbi:MAG TPA: DapH/DapD/GlmU-related protein [Acidimicrobiales bacterium]|nr:DapH/DapD/GlmU-related protein [Acidimicrobiales bacterium]